MTESERETAAVGRALAGRLRAGDVVLLDGPLGAGKTAFVRGLAEGLGADPGAVTSPTFTLVQVYPGTTPLQHADLYRLSAGELDDLALDELREGHVLAVEWPDRWADAPGDALRVTFEVLDADRRRLTLAG